MNLENKNKLHNGYKGDRKLMSAQNSRKNLFLE
jgi:hypothetical protein